MGRPLVESDMIRDTTHEAARVRWSALSRMSGQERLRQALELTDLVLTIRADGARARRERRGRESRLESSSSKRPGVER